MRWTPRRERVWRAIVALFAASIIAFPPLASFAGQAVPYDAGVMFSSALVVSVFCYGVTRAAVSLVVAVAVGALVGFAVRPLHPPWWAFSIAAVVVVWGWNVVRRRERARATT